MSYLTRSVATTQTAFSFSGEVSFPALGKKVAAIERKKSLSDRIYPDEQRLRDIAAAARVMIYEVGLEDESVLLVAGLRGVLGYDESEIPHQLSWWIKQILPEDRKGRQQELVCLLKNGRDFCLRYRVLHKFGYAITVESSGRVVRDSTGKAIRIAGRVIDVSREERRSSFLRSTPGDGSSSAPQNEAFDKKSRAAFAEWITRDRSQEQFLAVLAHELRNPLAPIRSAFQLMNSVGCHPCQMQKARTVGERQLSALTRLVDDLLDISRISSGAIRLRKEPVELTRVLQMAIETALPHFEAGGHKFSLASSARKIVIEADCVRMSQAIANLLINAANYSEAGGEVKLGIRIARDRVLVEVKDRGVAIECRVLETMLRDFEAPVDRPRGCLGIGLGLAKLIVELHGGSINAISQGRGKGSIFSIELPIVAEEEVCDRIERQVAKEELVEQSKCRILVVDDNCDAANLLGELIATLGHEVKSVYSGTDALREAKKWQPDVVILDIGMPGMSGYETAVHLREEADERGVTIVALTGWGQDEFKAKGHEAGFDHYLVKPADISAIESIVDSRTKSRNKH